MIEHQGYQIKTHKEHQRTWIVAVAGKGGSIPNALLGMFTSVGTAREAIDLYLANKPPVKDKLNASKERATSGG
jgi:hypothetical protein